MSSQTLVPAYLADLPEGQRALISALPRESAVACRLIGLGVYEGACVWVVQAADPMIIQARHTRIGMARELAAQIAISGTGP